MAPTDPKRRGEVLEKTRDETRRPELFRVVLLNDDYTAMDFVVEVLEQVFAKSPAEAHRVMMHVHTRGSGVAGVYSHEVAETKVGRVHELAHQAGYPLRCSVEPE